ncbi:unnamed protein product, partial [Urochloa humidicola]
CTPSTRPRRTSTASAPTSTRTWTRYASTTAASVSSPISRAATLDSSAAFTLSEIAANLSNHALYGSAEKGTAEHDIKNRIMDYLNIPESEYLPPILPQYPISVRA